MKLRYQSGCAPYLKDLKPRGNYKQGCIPVGCVPSAVVAISGGGSAYVGGLFSPRKSKPNGMCDYLGRGGVSV